MAATLQTSGAWPRFVALDGADQWWSDVMEPEAPRRYPDTPLNVSAQGLTGTACRLRRRLRAEHNPDVVAGPWEICGPDITTSMSDTFPGADERYEYDLGVPPGGFAAGNVVYVKLGI